MSGNLFESEEDCGYHLEFFEFYNWGVFDGKVYKIDCKGKSVFLTGKNGSGKTTIVDALLSLLVPPQSRLYNPSSDSEKKSERTEDSYVLGSYGSIQDENSTLQSTQNLRERDEALSILNGCFYDKSTNSFITLTQVRYFVQTGLKKVFAITQKKLEIDTITKTLSERDTKIDRDSKWQKVLTEVYATTFFGDSFAKYSNTFLQLFGFRTEKALKLFNKIVGLKVLSNLTKFIRENMIEEGDLENEFQKLNENYENLITCDNEIKKAKKQIELIEPIILTGEKFNKAKNEKASAEGLCDCVPYWTAKTAIKVLGEEEANLDAQISKTQDALKQNTQKQNNIQEEINAIIADRATNQTAKQIEKIDFDLRWLTEKKERAEKEKTRYEGLLNTAQIKAPKTQEQFEKTAQDVIIEKEKVQSEKKELDDKLFKVQKSLEETSEQLEGVRKELESLGLRDSNIPLKNIEIRRQLCTALNCAESELPFAGELIKVKDTEEGWRRAIEKVLHNFALCILVKGDLYQRVTDYVKKNKIGGEKGGRIVYFKAESCALKENDASKNYLPGKLEIKKGNTFENWLKDYISQNFYYRCTDDTQEFLKEKKAVTSSALIKNDERHEKDDRKATTSSTDVLGWDNTQKRKFLSAQLDELEKKKSETKKELEKIEMESWENEERKNALRNLEEFSSWVAIDTESVIKKIDNLHEERKTLADSKDVKDLQQRLDEKKGEMTFLVKKFQELSEKLGALNYNLSNIQKELVQNKTVLNTQYSDKAVLEKAESQIPTLQAQFPELCFPKTFEKVVENSGIILEKLRKKIATFQNSMNGYTTSIKDHIQEIKKPDTKLREEFGDWSAEFSDLGETAEFLDDWGKFYEKLKNDDLPKYQSQFKDYLHNSMKDEIICFKQFVKNTKDDIEKVIRNLNAKLKAITYSHNPDTYLYLNCKIAKDSRLQEFNQKLLAAIPDVALLSNDEDYEERIFTQIKTFLDFLKQNDNERDFVLDIRNHFEFSATEKQKIDDKEKQYYKDSSGLSTGEKAKLTYTILAAAIAYQFNIGGDGNNSFRFMIVDEAFSTSDPANSDYAMKLFKELNLQVMIVTPLEKINIVENYISSIQMTENKNTTDSRLLSMTSEEYQKQKAINEKGAK